MQNKDTKCYRMHQQHQNQNITIEHIVITKMKRIRFLNKAVRYHTRMNNIFTRIAFIKKREYPRFQWICRFAVKKMPCVCVCACTMVVDEPSLFHLISHYTSFALVCLISSHHFRTANKRNDEKHREK